MISYSKQYIDKKDISAVVKTLKSNFITQGDKVNEFEKKLKRYFGARHCCVVSSGTMALYLLSKVLDWNKNDLILCSPISFLAASNAAIFSGATPVFIDIDYNTGNLDTEVLKKKLIFLKKNKKKIKALVVTDYGGMPADWKELKKISKKYKFTLVNDNCHAMGAKYFNNKKYAVKYSDFVIQSYHAVKNLTTGEGGAVLSNNKKIIEKIRKLKTHGVVRKNSNKPWLYEMESLGFNARITDFQCSLGISQLKKLDKVVKKKQKLASIYSNHLRGLENIEIPDFQKNKMSALHLYPVKINFDNLKISKEKFFSFFKKKNIKLQVHYIPIFFQPFYKRKFKYKLNDFKGAIKFYNRQVSLPLYYQLKSKQILKVAEFIKKTLRSFSSKK